MRPGCKVRTTLKDLRVIYIIWRRHQRNYRIIKIINEHCEFKTNGKSKTKRYTNFKYNERNGIGNSWNSLGVTIPDIFASNIVHSTIELSPLYYLWNALGLLMVMANRVVLVDHCTEFLIRQTHDPVWKRKKNAPHQWNEKCKWNFIQVTKSKQNNYRCLFKTS